MRGSKSSGSSRGSKVPGAGGQTAAALLVLLLLAALSAGAVHWFHRRGDTLSYGDAEAHLNIARRIVDSRTPGYEQIGTVWLPLPHLLMLPLVGHDALWRSGLAGAWPAAACFVLAGTLLFLGSRRALSSGVAAAAATALFALNPNLLYLQATPMSEPVFLAGLLGLFYFTVLCGQRPSALAIAGAVVCSWVCSLARYEGWFLIPFATLYLLVAGGRRRWRMAAVFAAAAALAPLSWLAHNAWIYGDPLEFYRGPYSAKAIYQRALKSGMARYPGDGDWGKAILYYRAAAQLCLGPALFWLAPAGIAAALWQRRWWPLGLLWLPPAFYIWSMHSGATPIFVPHLWPHSYYNTRYGLAALPLASLAGAALVAVAGPRWRPWAALLVVGAAVAPWLLRPTPEAWIHWKEAQVNHAPRRAWTREAALYLQRRYRPGEGVFTSFGDLTGVFREAGIPLRETLHEGNGLFWEAATARPELFLREVWAVGFSGQRVATTVLRAGRAGPRFHCARMIAVMGAPVVEIHRR